MILPLPSGDAINTLVKFSERAGEEKFLPTDNQKKKMYLHKSPSVCRDVMRLGASLCI